MLRRLSNVRQCVNYMTEIGRKGVSRASSILNVIGGVSGLLTCCTVLIAGGRYTRQVDTNTEDINTLKRTGSPSLVAHERMDDERLADLKRRMEKVEDAILLLTENKVKFGVLEEKIDSVTKRVVAIEGDMKSAKTKL